MRTSARCLRAWLAEAIRDGRVQGSEREAFERHARTCTACTQEILSLDRLRAALQDLPSKRPDILSSRRQRTRLIAEIDAMSMSRARPLWPRATPALWAFAAVASASVALFFAARLHGWFAPASAAAETSIEVRPEPGTSWSRAKSENLDRLELTEGELWLRIQRSNPRSRVVIDVPAGEIEDFGTVLTVRVTNGRMARLVVEEGDVALRLKGIPEAHLHAGQTWTAPPIEEPRPVIPPLAHVVDLPPATASIAVHPAPKGFHAERAGPEDAGRKGARGHAVEQLPNEIDASNAEDKAYVKIIELVRAGKVTAARAAAQDYLLQFPDGFRRIEVMGVMTGSAVQH